MTADSWKLFGITDEMATAAAVNGATARRDGTRIINLQMRGKRGGDKDRAALWLRNAMLALAVFAAAAAAVSYEAQYVLVRAVKHAAAIAAVQAGIPDVGAAVFASLGIALALQGKRAIRARALNVVCVGISVVMNALAAHGGWRPLAVWVMAPVLYALASDTLIGVLRAWSIARQRALDVALANDEVTPLAVLGGVLLWLLRLSVAPWSTLTGFRNWVVEECPTAPGRQAAVRAGAGEQLGVALTAAASAEEAAAAARAELEEQAAGHEAERLRALSEAEQSVAAAVRDARSQVAQVREAAERQVAQVREDAERQRNELRAVLEGQVADLRTRAEHAETQILRVRAERRPVTSGPQATGPAQIVHDPVAAARRFLGLTVTPPHPAPEPGRHRETKTGRFLALVIEHHGPLADLPVSGVSQIAGELAPAVDLHAGSARSALLKAVRTSQNGGAS